MSQYFCEKGFVGKVTFVGNRNDSGSAICRIQLVFSVNWVEKFICKLDSHFPFLWPLNKVSAVPVSAFISLLAVQIRFHKKISLVKTGGGSAQAAAGLFDYFGNKTMYLIVHFHILIYSSLRGLQAQVIVSLQPHCLIVCSFGYTCQGVLRKE